MDGNCQSLIVCGCLGNGGPLINYRGYSAGYSRVQSRQLLFREGGTKNRSNYGSRDDVEFGQKNLTHNILCAWNYLKSKDACISKDWKEAECDL